MNNHSNDPADSSDAHASPFLITFSGIDGAGKTTQIEQLASYLRAHGFLVTQLSFWDDVAACPNLRAEVGQRTANFSKTQYATDYSFSPKNNKHIRKWYLTAARLGLYVLDVLRLKRLLKSRLVKKSDVVIFDRYIYDQIANISSRSSAADLYRKMILRQTPAPDLAFILDIAPATAFARKPEYPLEFMYENRRNFLRLRKLAPQLITISDGHAEDVKTQIHSHICRSRLVLNNFASGKKTEVTEETSVVLQQSSCRVQNEPTTSM
jgi:thymidylate kinase